MKEFEFKLENILKLKKHQEKLEKQFFANIAKRLDFEKNHLKNMIDYKNFITQYKQEKVIEGIKLRDLKLWEAYIDKINKEISYQEAKVLSVYEELEEARAKLSEVVKNRKCMEKLRSRKKKQYIKTKNKIIQNLLDEKASIIYSCSSEER
ncbi:MAG: flagellar protein FliJ [Thermosediminibacterales bacterium]|nr:flagellar protein FliJ [Thermosediminibacterales bacterium]